jgi:hypothetical protein
VAARAVPRESWEVPGGIEIGRVGEKEMTINMNACKLVCANKFIVFFWRLSLCWIVIQDLIS